MNRLEQLRAKRLELIKNIATAADQIAALDCEIEAIQMNLLEEDLNRQQEAAMSKGKSHSRGARVDIMKSNERRERRLARRYDRQQYDKPRSQGES